MRAVPTWFGPQGRPLFGWLHVPEGGMARGAVVCCPTMGVEYASAHRAIRTLAEQLAAAGFLALRFDYEGTGDSSGDESGPGQLESWRRSAREAVALVRECGAARVAMVGIRIGGTLAAETAASDGDVDALVLWDPCGNGRSFVREQQALMALSIGDLPSEGVELDPGAVEVLGSVLSAETVADLGTLDLTKVSHPSHGGPSCWSETTGRRRRGSRGLSAPSTSSGGWPRGRRTWSTCCLTRRASPRRPSPWCSDGSWATSGPRRPRSPRWCASRPSLRRTPRRRRRAGGPARPPRAVWHPHRA